ncbi:MAG: hypothetical protein AAF768_03290 [Pseudomonadota bacterium]
MSETPPEDIADDALSSLVTSRVAELAKIKRVRDHPVGDNALYVMDIIDSKVSSVIAYISILIASVLIFASKDGPYLDVNWLGISFSQAWLVGISLVVAVASVVLALTCIWVIDIKKTVLSAVSEDEAALELERASEGRKIKYLWSLRLSFVATVSVVALMSTSLGMQ